MKTKTITTTYKVQFKNMSSYEFQLRQECALVWNNMVKVHKYIRKKQWQWPTKNNFQKHLKKKGFKLHSQTIQALTDKFFSNIDTTRTNRKTDKKARYPYKEKYLYNVIWKGQAIKIKGNRIKLPNGRGNDNLTYKLPKGLSKLLNNGAKVVQAELSPFCLNLTITQVINVIERPSKEKIAAIDLGLIHTAMITEGSETLAFVGRGLRSINQRYNKSLAKIVKKQSKCDKYSRKWKKLQKRKKLIAKDRANYIRNFYHHVSKGIVDFALKHEITKVVYGDIANITKNKKKKMSKRTNQEMCIISLGQLMKLVKYKLNNHDIELEEIDESYTSQTCPVCGHRHKPKGRIFKCTKCQFLAFRDEVGTYNILNRAKNEEIKVKEEIPTGKIKYLRVVKHYTSNRSRVADQTYEVVKAA